MNARENFRPSSVYADRVVNRQCLVTAGPKLDSVAQEPVMPTTDFFFFFFF